MMGKTFSAWLISELNRLGWSQADLAYHADVSRTAISDVISEKRSAGVSLATSIAQALGYSPETVFRKAGLLPPKPDDEITLEEWRFVLEQLSEEDREELLNIARLKIERRENKQKQNTTQRKAEGLA